MRPDVPICRALWRSFRQLPGAVRSRRRARALARISDTEAFRRPLGGYYRDRFASFEPAPAPLRVLFVSPYPICPPVHGGGVFMYQTLREMAKLAEVHVVELLDWPHQEKDNLELREFCASAEWLVRPSGKPRDMGSLLPMPCASSPIPIWSGSFTASFFKSASTCCSSSTRRWRNIAARSAAS